MNKAEERLDSCRIATNLEVINRRIVKLAEQLKSNGIPLEAIKFDYWPRYNHQAPNIGIWDGDKHIQGEDGYELKSTDILGFVKSRQILRRRF